MKQCSTNYQVQLVPLAFDIVSDGMSFAGKTTVNFDDHIITALKDQKFLNTVAKAVREYTDTAVKDIKNSKHIDVTNANPLIDTSMTAFRSAVETSVKKDSKYHQLKQEANAFKQAFECSPTGIWVDKNKTTLIVVGAVGIVSGVAYMYKNKTGDKIAELSQGLLDKAWKVGTINLNTKVTNFKPSKREFGIALGASGQWQSMNPNFNIKFLARNNNYDLSSESSITVALSTTQTIALGLNHQAEGSFGPPADEKHTSSNELSAYAKLKYKDNATEFDIAAKLGSDKIYSVLASLRINF